MSWGERRDQPDTTYRADIDGLRALAVVSVIAYHASEPLLPGGFIGVDIFFVLSGYLITRLIAADVARKRFSLAAFYVRRVKRILPALFVVLFGTLALGAVVLTPIELAQLARTVAVTAAFMSNIEFWASTGYFDTAAEAKPLLHTWSLGVEEQFYLIWPVVLLGLLRLRLAFVGVAVASVASFAAAATFVAFHQPTAFYLLPTRAWELLAGALLALWPVPVRVGRPVRELCAVVGLAMIGAALLALDRASAFPGANALLPCVGTALLIVAGTGGETTAGRYLFATRPAVFVGLISYSLYLWHWPLLSLARVVARNELSGPHVVGVVAAAACLAVLTWRYVEVPLRVRGETPPAFPVLSRYVLTSMAAVAIGVTLFRTDGLIALADPELAAIERARFDVNPLSGHCLRWQADDSSLPQEPCLAGGDRFSQRLVVWGDSHADAVAPAFVEVAAGAGLATHQLTMAGCPPLAEARVVGEGADYTPCTRFNARVMRYATEDPAVSTVALVARWTLYTENARFGGDDPGPITYLVDDHDRGWTTEASRRVFARALEETIAVLERAGKHVIVLGTIPPLGVNVPGCLARNHMPLTTYRSCGASTDEVLPHLAWADDEIERIAGDRRLVCTYLPKRALCPGEHCQSTAEGQILYANDDHLSLPGARFLGKHLDFDRCLAPLDHGTPR